MCRAQGRPKQRTPPVNDWPIFSPPLPHPRQALDQHRRRLALLLERLGLVAKPPQLHQLLLREHAPQVALDGDGGKLPPRLLCFLFWRERERAEEVEQ